MKKIISFLLITILVISSFAGCGKDETPAAPANDAETVGDNGSEESDAGEKNEVEDDTEVGENGSFDMDKFLADIAAANPGADLKTIEQAILASPFFALFTHQDTVYVYPDMEPEYYYPGLNYEYKPEGVKESICIADYITNSGAIVYVIDLKDGIDPNAFAAEFKSNADPKWMDFENGIEGMTSLVIDGRVYFAMYNPDMKPIEGKMAEKPRDFVEMFHDYIAKNPEAATLELAEYFISHQKFTGFNASTVNPGRIRGFGSFDKEVDITGFTEGAGFIPLMTPSLFIGYVFKLDEGSDVKAFMKYLEDNANLSWNICMTANTIITEADGNTVLFMMCQEDVETSGR